MKKHRILLVLAVSALLAISRPVFAVSKEIVQLQTQVQQLQDKFAAFGLAGVIWGMSFLASGTTVRTVSVPIEFSNVPSGMQVASQSADTLEVEVQGSPWVVDSVSLGKLVSRFDIRCTRPGWHALRFEKNSLDLPTEIAVDRVVPGTVRVQIVPSAGLG